LTRRKSSGPDAGGEPLPAPHVVDPNGIYLVQTFEKLLHLKRSTVRREVREGRLRVSKRSGRYYLLGRWILEWLESGEVHGKRRQAEDEVVSYQACQA
jgi:Helix-turn-helix domain